MMKVKLNEELVVKGKLCEAGDVVIVQKDEGERMIVDGIANRLIEVPENRVIGDKGRFFRTSTLFGR